MKLQVVILLLGLILIGKATADTTPVVINALPGYKGTLPFNLETGYIGVGDEVKQLFYYFVESQRDPAKDPLLVWVSGGPGFSSLYGFFYIHGPLSFDLSYKFDKTLPTLMDNEYTWTKFMNILYIDGPAGTGFSYATTPEAYATGNYKFANDLKEFVHKWLASHESYRSNPVYLSGDGFSGNSIPLLVDYLQKDNAAGEETPVNVAGYLLVGPGANFSADFNFRYEYAWRVGFIADEVFGPANATCQGYFLNPSTPECRSAVEDLEKLIGNINTAYTLDPSCGGDQQLTPLPPAPSPTFESFLKLPTDDQLLADNSTTKWCRSQNHEICTVWANFEEVQDALGVLPGTKPYPWALYNETLDKLSYDKDDIKDLIPVHQALAKTNIRGLIMCGDHDMDIPHLSVQKWMWTLGVPVSDPWRASSVDINETAGFTRKFEDDVFAVTFALVKGGGHFVPEFKPRESYMVANWTDGLPL